VEEVDTEDEDRILFHIHIERQKPPGQGGKNVFQAKIIVKRLILCPGDKEKLGHADQCSDDENEKSDPQ
jgi:hypothetical protein